MIELFKYNGNFRIKIVNETLEFKTIKEFQENLTKILNLKFKNEPYEDNKKLK